MGTATFREDGRSDEKGLQGQEGLKDQPIPAPKSLDLQHHLPLTNDLQKSSTQTTSFLSTPTKQKVCEHDKIKHVTYPHSLNVSRVYISRNT